MKERLKIQNKPIDIAKHYLDKVTYIPTHVDGNIRHKDCDQGVIIRTSESFVYVLYCKGRTIQATKPEDLVWG